MPHQGQGMSGVARQVNGGHLGQGLVDRAAYPVEILLVHRQPGVQVVQETLEDDRPPGKADQATSQVHLRAASVR